MYTYRLKLKNYKNEATGYLFCKKTNKKTKVNSDGTITLIPEPKNNEENFAASKDLNIINTFNKISQVEEFLFDNLHGINNWLRKNKNKLVIEKNDNEYKGSVENLEIVNVTDEELEEERIKRIKALKLERNAEQDMIKNKTIWISENRKMIINSVPMSFPVNFFLSGYTYEKEVRKGLQKLIKGDNIPYFAIVDHLKDGGLMISFLFVSIYKNGWNTMERFHTSNYKEDMKNGEYVDAWVFDTTDCMELPDLGTIQIKRVMGGVKRVA